MNNRMATKPVDKLGHWKKKKKKLFPFQRFLLTGTNQLADSYLYQHDLKIIPLTLSLLVYFIVI